MCIAAVEDNLIVGAVLWRYRSGPYKRPSLINIGPTTRAPVLRARAATPSPLTHLERKDTMTATQPVIVTPVPAPAKGDNAKTDPAKMGWMQGFPPPADKVITFDNHLNFPQVRWSVAHFRELVPTADISRGHGPVTPLPRALRNDFDGATFIPMGGDKPMTWEQSLDANYTDAILVLHKGTIVYERYFGVMTPDQPHVMWSGTKSYVGLLAAILIAEGKLDEKAKVATIVPELKDTGWSDATVRQVADQTTNLAYIENKPGMAIGTADDVDFTNYTIAAHAVSRPADYDGPKNILDFLKTIKKADPHGENFRYRTINTDVLGLLIEKVTGKSLYQVLSERIWQQLGMENDAYMVLDDQGTPLAGAELTAPCPTRRVLAKWCASAAASTASRSSPRRRSPISARVASPVTSSAPATSCRTATAIATCGGSAATRTACS